VQKKPCLAAAELSGEEKHGALPLLELPESALTLIARQVLVQGADGYLSMLAVSRSARDAVLRAIDRITLDLRPDHFGLRKTKSSPDYGSLGRLLQRACTEAAPGLSVVLKLEDGHGLPTLLQPALNTSNGFSRVHTLEVRYFGAWLLLQCWTVTVRLCSVTWGIDVHILSTSVAGCHPSEQLPQLPRACHAVLETPVHYAAARSRHRGWRAICWAAAVQRATGA
jgi:hypothetical protein